MDKITIPDKKGLRDFGLVTSAILVALFGLLFPWLFSGNYPLWPWWVAGFLSGWALLWPDGLKSVYWAWMWFGNGLGWINSRLILALMFYGIITPIGLILRIIGKNPLKTHSSTAKSYRKPSHSRSPQHMERPF